MVQHILNDIDPGVLKTTLVNFFIYGISSCYTSVNWDAISLEGDETTTGSRRSEKEVKRAQRTQKNCVQRTKKHRLPVGRRCFFQPSPRGEGQGTQSRTGKSVISAAGAAPRDSKTKKRAWKGPSMHVSGQMGFPRLGLAAGQLCWPWAG